MVEGKLLCHIVSVCKVYIDKFEFIILERQDVMLFLDVGGLNLKE